MTFDTRRRIASLGFPLALVAALMLLLITESSYQRSTRAIRAAAESYQLRLDIYRLRRLMVDAEAGQRGYLLTGKQGYLAPYAAAAKDIGTLIRQLAPHYGRHPESLKDFETLSRAIATKLSELELTVRQRSEGRDATWRGLMESDLGEEAQQTMRSAIERLAAVETRRLAGHQAQVQQSLTVGRLGISATTLLGLIAIYYFFRLSRLRGEERERQRAALQAERDSLEAQVLRRTRQLTQLAQHLQTTQEAERSRLARELHDELGALLTAAKLDVARLRSRLPSPGASGDAELAPEISDRLNHLNEALNSGIALKRRIIEDLRPSSLSHLGLVVSLEILTREFAQRSGVAMHTALQPVQLSESGDLTVYRFVQEALTNIAKYAHASRVDVSLHNEPDGIAVTVTDDGDGFDPQVVRSSAHGLVGMRYRIEAEGGRLQVDSSPGGGTRLGAWLPSPAPHPNPDTPPAPAALGATAANGALA